MIGICLSVAAIIITPVSLSYCPTHRSWLQRYLQSAVGNHTQFMPSCHFFFTDIYFRRLSKYILHIRLYRENEPMTSLASRSRCFSVPLANAALLGNSIHARKSNNPRSAIVASAVSIVA